MSNIDWIPFETLQQLKEIDAKSNEIPVVIFKHSTRCSISATAMNRLERKWDPMSHPEIPTYYLDVIQFRDISQHVAKHYTIAHESPQMLIIHEGTCIYDSSHMGISYDELLDVIKPMST